MPPTRHVRAGLWVGLAVLALVGGSVARGEPRELPASVVWRRDDLIYVAAADSGVLARGMTLSIRHGKREVASGAIVQLLEPRVAVARVGSGSLAREKRLDRLRVRGELSAPLPSLSMPLMSSPRVGVPGRERTNLLFACATPVAARFEVPDYAADSMSAGAYRFLRQSGGAQLSGLDTLFVLTFSDAADEEIALERGEIDVAVFWPGELSARMRRDPRWRDAALALRTRGVVVGETSASDTAGVSPSDLQALNRDVFGGDLMPWSELEPDSTPRAALAPARWTVDRSIPGARVLERALARIQPPSGTRTVRLTYRDVPAAARDAASTTWRTRGVTPLFAVRCPVLSTFEARASVEALGAGVLANLVRCGGTP